MLAVVAAGVQAQQAFSAGENYTKFRHTLDQVISGLFKIPSDFMGGWYNRAAELGSKIVGKCKVQKYEDADACRNVSEMIRARGFGVEEYDVITEDGYILNVQRVINPLVDPVYRAKKRPVLIQPGISTTSVDYVISSLYARPVPWPPVNQSEAEADADEVFESAADEDRKHPRSLAMYLANRGYDVYLGNNRGTVYGQRHVNKTVLNAEFWDFSIDEFGLYDVPAIVAFVRRFTGHDKIAYVGWSQGAASMLGLQSYHPEYADIIEPFVVMSPAAFLGYIHTKFYKRFFPLFARLPYANNGIFFSFLSKYIFNRLGGPTALQRKLFALAVTYPLFGRDTKGMDAERIPTYLRFTPSGTSMKNFVHWCQLYVSKRFRRRNMGAAGNRLKYGTDEPPDYPVSRIRSNSIVFFSAETDFLGDPEDRDLLLSQMTVKPYRWFNVTAEVPEFSHVSFLYHKKIGTLVNRRVYRVLEEFNRPLAAAAAIVQSSVL